MKLAKKDVAAYRYMILCNLLESMWHSKKPHKVNLHDLTPLTSDDARRVAAFIDDLYQPGGTEEYFEKLSS